MKLCPDGGMKNNLDANAPARKGGAANANSERN